MHDLGFYTTVHDLRPKPTTKSTIWQWHTAEPRTRLPRFVPPSYLSQTHSQMRPSTLLVDLCEQS